LVQAKRTEIRVRRAPARRAPARWWMRLGTKFPHLIAPQRPIGPRSAREKLEVWAVPKAFDVLVHPFGLSRMLTHGFHY
jgi:hypothetical protein